MKNTIHQKGFTVLEVIVALLLFSLLMGSLWQFYGETYRGYISFDQQADLSEQARLVTNFIREEIRLSDQVTIDTTVQGRLTEMKLNTLLSSSKKTKREIVLDAIKEDTDEEEKTYSLYYSASGTKSLISDKVYNIKVTQEEGSSIVQFECTVAIVRDGKIIQQAVSTFSESLQYKEPYTEGS